MKRYFCIVLLLSITHQIYAQQNPDCLKVSPEHPINISDTALIRQLWQWTGNFVNIANTHFRTHPSAINFPGAPQKGYKTIKSTFQLLHKKTSARDSALSMKYVFAMPQTFTLYSTGLYAPPGTKIPIKLPDNWDREDVWVCIGAHRDVLFNTEENWRRMPIIISEVQLKKDLSFISSPFGGLIYFGVYPRTQSFQSDIILSNVIKAPYYVYGKTTASDWANQLKNNRAPWGEIATDKIIITLPDSALRKIKDPQKTLEIWNKIISTEYDLSQLPVPFIRPVRLVVDEQISNGAMHSGYPIMIHHSPSQDMLSLNSITDPAKLLKGIYRGANWGYFHEIGHNLQNIEWVPDGTIEVGCNFYSLYLLDRLIGSRDSAHECLTPAYQKMVMTDYFSRDTRQHDYEQNPFLGLIPFIQLQKKFGWNTFKQVFKQYIDHPNDSLDYAYKSEDDRRKKNLKKTEVLVTRFSEQTKTNLSPFFKAWGFPVSTATDEALKKYASWMPEELTPYLSLKKGQ